MTVALPSVRQTRTTFQAPAASTCDQAPATDTLTVPCIAPRNTPSAPLALPKPHGVRARPKSGAGKVMLVTAGVVASLMGAARAYPCTGYGSDANQYFANGNNTLYGVVHGWFSDCYDETVACGEQCSTSSNGQGGSSTRCWTVYCTYTETDKQPSDYVNAAAAKVQACGFTLTDSVPGNTSVRIANGNIERNLLVKVSVNQLNLTDTTDPAILCLHGMA